MPQEAPQPAQPGQQQFAEIDLQTGFLPLAFGSRIQAFVGEEGIGLRQRVRMRLPRGGGMKTLQRLVDGLFIQHDDRRPAMRTDMLAADIESAPVAGDFIDVKTERYRVVRSEPFQPGGEVLYYDLQLRR